MKPQAVLRHIFQSGIIATLPPTLPLQDIVKVGDALLASPVLSVQIAWQDGVEGVIADLQKRANENMVIGISGIETAVQLEAALSTSPHFVVTNRYDRDLAKRCQEANILLIPTLISIVAANAAYQNGIRLVNMRTGGPQGSTFIEMVIKSIPGLHVAVEGNYTVVETTTYAKAGAAALFVEHAIYAGGDQTMADLITNARQIQQAWDDGMRQRRGRLSPTRPSLN